MEIGAIKGDKAYILTYEAGVNEYDKYLAITQDWLILFKQLSKLIWLTIEKSDLQSDST